jgi:hypothetical protein
LVSASEKTDLRAAYTPHRQWHCGYSRVLEHNECASQHLLATNNALTTRHRAAQEMAAPQLQNAR